MPYKIIGKVVGDDGYPIYQQSIVEEINNQGKAIANILTAEDTGSFVFFATSENALINVKSPGYKTKTYTAKDMPSAIELLPMDESVINVTRKPTKTGFYLALGTLGTIAIIALAMQNRANRKKPQSTTAKKLPAAKPKPKTRTKAKAKTVTV
ncbi:hypothetical protein V1389_14665 [Flavobacterium rakeshii]|uniref:hypothetical protein n=1 Tax=Flavobacterium rakeshii TaxID=1038845 RepID=UPI002E7B3412|nr:hypothetical protein [Flavobacterium rakeshii]MEE1899589.1 hypothetical protein [Flavobacterium rakeshii]